MNLGRDNSLVKSIVSGRLLSWRYYDPLDVTDIAGLTCLGGAAEVENKWRDDAFNTSDGRQTRFAMMTNDGLGWKIGGLGTGP